MAQAQPQLPRHLRYRPVAHYQQRLLGRREALREIHADSRRHPVAVKVAAEKVDCPAEIIRGERRVEQIGRLWRYATTRTGRHREDSDDSDQGVRSAALEGTGSTAEGPALKESESTFGVE